MGESGFVCSDCGAEWVPGHPKGCPFRVPDPWWVTRMLELIQAGARLPHVRGVCASCDEARRRTDPVTEQLPLGSCALMYGVQVWFHEHGKPVYDVLGPFDRYFAELIVTDIAYGLSRGRVWVHVERACIVAWAR